jgi:hypothetical protein
MEEDEENWDENGRRRAKVHFAAVASTPVPFPLPSSASEHADLSNDFSEMLDITHLDNRVECRFVGLLQIWPINTA